MKSEGKQINWITETGVKDANVSCTYLTYVPPQAYTWQMTATAEAQGNNPLLDSTNNLLSVPLYIIVFFFLIFTVTMSTIYMYHWVKFNLNDPFIKTFTIIYFVGLCLILIPLLYNLIMY